MEITINIPDVLASKAELSGLAPSVYVERLLDRIAAISANRSDGQAQLRDELMADWQHYQATGLHLNDDEVEGWLVSLEQGHPSDLPELHV